MWRIFGLVLALAMTAGGALWLLFQIFIADDAGNLVAAAIIVLAMGAYWLWTDYIKPRHEGDV